MKIFSGDKGKRVLRVLWLLAILVVIVGSLLPSYSAPIRALDDLKISDKVEHIAAYLALAFLPALHERPRFVAAAAAGAVALAVGLEYAQFYSGWRDFEVGDMIAGFAGVCLGILAGIAARWAIARWPVMGVVPTKAI